VLKLVAYCCGGRESMHIDRRVGIAGFGDALPAAHRQLDELRVRRNPEPARHDRVDDQIGHGSRAYSLIDRPLDMGTHHLARQPPRQAPAQARRPVSVGIGDNGADPPGAQHAHPRRKDPVDRHGRDCVAPRRYYRQETGHDSSLSRTS